MLNLGNVPAGSTLYVPFGTYNAAGASVTITGLAATDIEIYKNGSITQRSSDAGYTLLDTDGIDFDGITGIHGFSIDLSDNTDAGFYAAGSTYWLVVSSITVDSQTVNFVYYFTIDKASAANVTQWLGTAAATPTVAGVPEVDVTHWIGTAAATPTTAGVPEVDITFIAGAAVSTTTAQLGVNAVQISGDGTAADNLETAFDDTAGAVPWQGISHQGTLQSVTSTTVVVLAASASAEDDVYIGHTIHFVSGTTGVKQSALASDYVGATKTLTLAAAVPVALTGTVTYKMLATAPSSGGSGLDAAGVRAAVGLASANLDTQLGAIDDLIDTEVGAIKTKTDFLPSATAGAAGGLFIAGTNAATTITTALTTTFTGNLTGSVASVSGAVGSVTGNVGGNVAGSVGSVTGAVGSVTGLTASDVGAIKTKTDSLTFTVAGVVNAGVYRINGVTIIGDGSGTPFNV